MSDPSQFLLYTAPDGAVKVDVLFKEETVWLTQKALAELFGVKVPAVNKHLKNIFESGELMESSVVSILETTASDGKNYLTRFYNLDAIIAVGYRVNSYQATQFRIWATTTLREFLNAFLELSNYPILQAHGKVTAIEAKLKAEGETNPTARSRTANTFRTSTGRSNASRVETIYECQSDYERR